MSKLTEYPRDTKFDDGDVLLKDGINGTKIILASDALADMIQSKNDIVRIKAGMLSALSDDATAIIATNENPVDLNDYKTPGNYRVKSSDVAANIINSPSKLSYRLLVIETTTKDFNVVGTPRLMQIAFINSSGDDRIAVRTYNGSGLGMWQSWKYLATTDYADAIKEFINYDRPVFSSGGLYQDTGIEFSTSDRSRTDFISVAPGETIYISYDATIQAGLSVFEFANSTKTTSDNNLSLNRVFRSVQDYSGFVPFKIGNNTNYIRCQVARPLSEVGSNVVFLHETDYLNLIRPKVKIVPSVVAMKADHSLIEGDYVQTLGFSSEGDNGDGIYEINSGLTSDNCSVFELDNHLFAKRIFVGDTITLESLNFPGVSYSVVNEVIAANGIKNVKCGDIETNSTIVLEDYDFDFGTINYTGTNYAIATHGYIYHSLTGNVILAPNGSRIYEDCTASSVDKNFIKINKINVKNNGITIHPTNGRGAGGSTYFIRSIECQGRGLYVYFTANSGTYSWEGEDLFSIGNIKAQNTNHNGVAIEYYIPTVNVTTQDGTVVATNDDGTITGITFLNLAVEYSDIGIKMRCASTRNPKSGVRSAAGIKSIYINNMRTREADRTTTFLDATGLIWDVYIKPTAPIRMSQWLINTSATKSMFFVDAPLFTRDMTAPIGYGIRARRSIRYIDKTIECPITISDNADYADLGENDTSLYMSKYFLIDGSVVGKSINLKLFYSYDETARELYIRMPKAVVDNSGEVPVTLTATVTITFKNPSDSSTVITNTDTENDHLYSLSCFTDRNSPYAETHLLRDLGPIT